MRNIQIEAIATTPIAEQAVELVERKGAGHPDTLCDGIMEAVSVALCGAYLSAFGRVLHHNVDKSLLVAGRSAPRPGGGRLLEPMRLVVGDRATRAFGGVGIDLEAVVHAAAAEWMARHLRFVDPAVHVVIQNELKGGSVELTDLFERPAAIPGANDTSAAVGFAPLSDTERLVLATERYLNSPALKARFPEAGEDVKVMGMRRGSTLVLTVAVAFVDRFVEDVATYFRRKAELAADLETFLDACLAAQPHALDRIDVQLNTLDDAARGEGGIYLTVLGTSAEGADSGQVGRGNRVNGLITLNRPMGSEAAAGKNPVSHVGKIYSLLTHQLAGRIHAEVPGIEEVTVRLCSQIGHPIDQPWIASAQLRLAPGVKLPDVAPAAAAIVDAALADILAFTGRLTRGELPVW